MKIFYYVLEMAMISLLMSCGGQKALVKTQEDVEIVVPCSGPEYMTDKTYFRASAMGFSNDMMMAKKKGLAEARAELATSMNAAIKRVTDNYASSYQLGEQEEARSRFQDLARTVVNEKLSGTRVICEKTMKTPEGAYKVYVAVELAGDEIAKSMQNRIQDDEKLRTDFEYEKFKKVFDEEMEKAAKEK
ncbi:hypothetical protein [uncultured Odoribacter sp.]|uniref:hypothetical protein n=1 Tax=uncultured Odoribacter sp. TaxID=876416 RepID=UPI00260B8BF1|nr:hypothetical protein [uncultured Odoribacter sp.]